VKPDLFADIPASVRLKGPLSLPPPRSELELLQELGAQSGRNQSGDPFLGAGSYRHFIPSAVKHIIGRSEFSTAYTPYQAEASQGTLQAIYEYQSMICGLTGMEAANASMYDGATALAEAAMMAARITGRRAIAVSAAVHPHYRAVLKTYCAATDLTITEIPFDLASGLTEGVRRLGADTAGLIIQQPNFFGNIEPADQAAELAHKNGALFIVSADPISLGLLKPPGEYGADIVVGEGQSLGNPQSWGGPGLGIFAAKKEFLRQMPGRLVGATTDLGGKRGFTLTLSTREQHIRRERATSNICSNQALCALAACVYLSLLGKAGLKKVAELCLQKSNYLKRSLPASSLLFPSTPIFKEFAVKSRQKVGVDLGTFYPELAGSRLLCVTETIGKDLLDKLVARILAG
jgi:glycine dehydrogenase subunit 1